ncbi:hypothetical protein RRG08_012934 [Elysia crispata]|uniref:Uncharacterized protein n=1 Tax=Elysia crispata TaxID=231223 RepID=A0AAE1A050_9GAST|nr:hypothetical protein RRG08_012934 [Elysia crispata]
MKSYSSLDFDYKEPLSQLNKSRKELARCQNKYPAPGSQEPSQYATVMFLYELRKIEWLVIDPSEILHKRFISI